MRLRDYAENVPKPMITIGYRPILWHLMKYYAHFGFKDFILCLGYRADYIKDYFLTYNECVSNDFTLSEGGRKLELLRSDISDWRITFVDTGLNANIGQRLKAVEEHLAGEESLGSRPEDFAVDGLRNLYVLSDRGGRLRVLSPSGETIALLDVATYSDGSRFLPNRVAADGAGSIYLCNRKGTRIVRYR